MYDFDELEKKWITYKKNKYKKLALTAGGFIAVAFASAMTTYLILSHKQNDSQTLQTVKQQDKNEAIATQPLPQPQSPKEIVIISQNDDKVEQFRNLEQKEPKQDEQKPIIPVTYKKDEPRVAPKIYMETKSADLTETLEEKYSRQPSYSTALSLSSEYYKIGDYQKALYWAISANNIDPKGDKSWVMFAKASYKLGKKNDAINALENFVRTSASDSAKAALNQIKNNEL